MTAPAVEISAARLSTARLFGFVLIVATVIPFLSGGLAMTGAAPALSLQAVVVLLAAIHVPMTVYLLLGPSIRQMMRARPGALIVAPLLILAAVFAVNYLTTESRKAGTSTEYVYFLYFVTAWNLWHFGKQNIGVYSFFRASQKQSPMLPIERRLLLGGAVLGALSVFAITGDGFTKQFAGAVDMGWLLALQRQIGHVGIAGQAIMLAAVLVVLWLYRARHRWPSALMFFLSTNFFIAYYLLSAGASFGFVFACGTFAHGLQYCTFLGFHAGTARSWSRTASWAMPVAFALLAATLIDLFHFNLVFSAARFGGLLGTVGAAGDVIGSTVFTLNVGVLLVHFWLDSYFWRFKAPSSRAWMTSRYAFLLANRSAR
jgi:hypothetical protein